MRIEEQPVEIQAGGVILKGNLAIPQRAQGIVLFAHGSGSSRFSPRNQYVAEVLQKNNLATFLMDLLTKEEEEVDIQTAHLRFDIPFLADRLMVATKWLKNEDRTKNLSLSYFGSSTGAAAALIAAAKISDKVKAVVSRGGRPDLAIEYLDQVKAPTLFIVGGNDLPVIEMNQKAFQKLKVEKKMEIIPGATHLFEEPGTLERVAQLAAEWFVLHLTRRKE